MTTRGVSQIPEDLIVMPSVQDEMRDWVVERNHGPRCIRPHETMNTRSDSVQPPAKAGKQLIHIYILTVQTVLKARLPHGARKLAWPMVCVSGWFLRCAFVLVAHKMLQQKAQDSLDIRARVRLEIAENAGNEFAENTR